MGEKIKDSHTHTHTHTHTHARTQTTTISLTTITKKLINYSYQKQVLINDQKRENETKFTFDHELYPLFMMLKRIYIAGGLESHLCHRQDAHNRA